MPHVFFKHILHGTVLLSWMALIFLFSSMPGSEYAFTPTMGYYLERKSAHVIEYAFLTLFMVRFLVHVFPRWKFGRIMSLSALGALLYGVSDEWHQSFIPYRGAKITDVLIDGIGIVIMSLWLLWLLHISRKRI
ncbi:MAG: VanZ family protein [Minisyncoccota bacterium]